MIGIGGGARLSNIVEIGAGDDHRQIRAQKPQIREQTLGGVKELEQHPMIDLLGQ